MYELLMQNMRALEQVGRGETCDRRDDSPTKADAGPAQQQPRAERSSACSSRPCVVVGAEPAVRRSASLLDLRRRCAAARRGIRGVLPVLSSSSPVVDVTLGGALPPRRRRGRASRGGLRGGRRQPRAGHRRGVRGRAAPLLGLPPSTCGGVRRGVLPPRRLRGQLLSGWPRWRGSCTRSWPRGSPTLDASKTGMI